MTNPVLGTLLVAVGLLNAVWPSQVARFEEQLDAIGSKRSAGEVEPAEWKVLLTRAVGVLFVLFGVAVFLNV
jgi:ABC-type phosphate transport system auxiliary subunit